VSETKDNLESEVNARKLIFQFIKNNRIQDLKNGLGCHGNIKILDQWYEPLMEIK